MIALYDEQILCFCIGILNTDQLTYIEHIKYVFGTWTERQHEGEQMMTIFIFGQLSL